MSLRKFDVTIIGAGVIGCAIASNLSNSHSNILVIEAMPEVGTSTSRRNSGVIHSGIYYRSNFLKTTLAIEGQQMLYEWVLNKRIPYKKLGKIVVAFSDNQLDSLENLYKQAKKNNCANVALVTKQKIHQLEPNIKSPLAGLVCQDTGIMNPMDLTTSLFKDALSKKVEFKFNTTLLEIEKLGTSGFKLRTQKDQSLSRVVINCSGLYADRISAMAGINKYKIYP